MKLARSTVLLLMVCCLHVAGQTPGLTVKVHVSDEAGQPLTGITVQVKCTPRKFVTSATGDLTINNVPAHAVLVLTGVSMEETEMALDSRTELALRMKRTAAALEDVVVTGFQRIARK